MNVPTTDTPIYFYIGKQAKLKDSEEIITQSRFTIPYSVYKKTELSELSKQLVDVFENCGYFETIYNFNVLNCKEPRLYKCDDWSDVVYFEGFDPYDVPIPNSENSFDDLFNITLSGGVSKREGDSEWSIGFYVNFPKLMYQNIPIKNVCDNLRESFELFISKKSTHEEIEQIYEKFLKHKNNE